MLLGQDPKRYKLINALTNGVTAACVLVEKQVFLDVGGFDLKYEDIYQDCDLNLAIRKSGFDIFQCNDAILTHIDNASRAKEQKVKQATMVSDLHKFIDKWTTTAPPSIESKTKLLISFVTPVINKKEYDKFILSIEETHIPYEVICVKNKDANYSSAEVLNNLQSVCAGQYVVCATRM